MAGKPPSAPSAPPTEDLRGPVGGPPTYNEAMGWAPPAAPLIQPAPVPGHRPLASAGMQMQPAVPPSVVIVQQPVNTQVVLVGPKPAKLDCPACHASIKTTTETSNRLSAHLCCLVLCLIGCWPCFWLPYCMSSCKKVQHTCPNCKSYLGTFNE